MVNLHSRIDAFERTDQTAHSSDAVHMVKYEVIVIN